MNEIRELLAEIDRLRGELFTAQTKNRMEEAHQKMIANIQEIAIERDQLREKLAVAVELLADLDSSNEYDERLAKIRGEK